MTKEEKRLLPQAAKKFLNQFDRVYSWLYDQDLTEEDSRKHYYFNGKYLPDVFFETMKTSKFVAEFIHAVEKEREDIFLSDREAAAVCLTALQFKGLI